jgi:hypothetical protein
MAGNDWTVIDYEVGMFLGARDCLTSATSKGFPLFLKNAVVESAVLHTRILCDVFLARAKAANDITPESLFPDWKAPKYSKAKKLISDLASDYGTSKAVGSPCWEFNKMLAHPTNLRKDRYDYRPALARLAPGIQAILAEFECLRGVRFSKI